MAVKVEVARWQCLLFSYPGYATVKAVRHEFPFMLSTETVDLHYLVMLHLVQHSKETRQYLHI